MYPMSGGDGWLAAACVAMAVLAASGLAAAAADGAGGQEKLREAASGAGQRDYRFDGSISRPVLENYLSRAITEMDLLMDAPKADENLRMLTHVGAKFAGRAIYMWGHEGHLEKLIATAGPIAEKVRRADPDMMLQGCLFEIVSTEVAQVPVPAWALEEFGLSAGARSFRYEDMVYADGKFRDHWGKGSSVPDMSRPETRMWFTYLARRYIDAGVEAIHFGQVSLMDHRDADHIHWRDMMARVRRYAAAHARRHLLVCDAHVPTGGIVHDGKLMFDFHSFPLRVAEVAGKPEQGELRVGYLDSLYGRSKGGATPSGWSCDHLPYLVELDNFGVSGHPGKPGGDCFVWGYDEIIWFARQSESYRNDWLGYAWKWVGQHDPAGHLQMPGSRCLHMSVDGKRWYSVNTRGPAAPDGFNQEETIRAIWSADR
jgi:hypothetical protein